MFKTFLFDMGNVLLHFSHDRMCQQIADLCHVSPQAVRQFLIAGSRQWDLERGQISEQAFFQECCAEFQVTHPVTLEEFAHAASDIFTLNSTLVPVLHTLRQRGHRLVLLSNTSVSHYQFVRKHFSVLDPFDAFVLSFEVGALKPDPAIFHAALNQIQCAPHECFYTDDIPAYVAAGLTHGLHARQFTTTEQLITDLATLGYTL